MASEFLRRKTPQSSSTAYFIFFSLIFVTLIASFFWIESHNHQFTAQDRDSSKGLGLEPVRNPKPAQNPTPVTGPVPVPVPVPVFSSPGGITCDRSHFRYDLCLINGPALLDPVNATVYSIGPGRPNNVSEKVRPYGRKWEVNVMSKIREIELKSGPIGPRCGVQHYSPALVISAGGLTGNFFHDFNDGFIPLYITVNNLSIADRDVILVVDHARDWWVRKYGDVIRGFTKHPIIDLEKENKTHCFTWAAVGLVSHGFMTVDPKALSSPLTMAHFHFFLRNVFDQEVTRSWMGSRRFGLIRPPPYKLWPTQTPYKERRPKLVWLSRAGSRGRAILNQEKARLLAEHIGFDVFIYRPREFSLREAYLLINASHAMIGVHGAAMTHMLFLRPGAVLGQVVPLGLEWVGEACFAKPARDVGLGYVEYKLGLNESSLANKYDREDPILKDPKELMRKKGGWVQEVMNVYLKEQDVVLDLVRFRVYMERVYEKAKFFMELYG